MNKQDYIKYFYSVYMRVALNDQCMNNGGTISRIPYILNIDDLYNCSTPEQVREYVNGILTTAEPKLQARIELMIALEALAVDRQDDFPMWQVATSLMSKVKYDYLYADDENFDRIRCMID